MKRYVVLAVTASVFHLGSALSATAATADCNSALERVRVQMNAAGLIRPAKPTQLIVGKNGVEYTGAEVTFMQRQIHLAEEACQRGDSALSMACLEKVFAKLKIEG